MSRNVSLRHPGGTADLRVSGPGPDGVLAVARLDAEALAADAVLVRPLGQGQVLVRRGDGRERLVVLRRGRGVWVGWRGRSWYLEPAAGRRAQARSAAAASDEVRAPMTGVVIDVRATAGQPVRRGDLLATLEAMKMEYRLEAPREGVVADVPVTAGERVELGAVVVRLETEAPRDGSAAAGP